MTQKENYLRTVYFDRPDYIQMTAAINAACWNAYPQEFLCEQMEKHPKLFPNFVRPELPYTPEYGCNARKDVPYTDFFGCTWYTSTDGITGTVLDHPLEDWDAFAAYKAPDPEICDGMNFIDWDKAKESIRSQPDIFHIGCLRHGHTFLQLCDIRGYENLMFDMVDEEPLLWDLIKLVEDFNLSIVKHMIDAGVGGVAYAEDLGMQVGPMLAPEHFRKYILPSYRTLMQPAKDAGLMIHMHSDGDIRTLADDILNAGVDLLNLQDLVNGIDWIRDNVKGKACIELDIDRQNITRFGTPAQIDSLIREEVTKLGSPRGGLMFIHGLYPGTPMENVEALYDAMERYMGYFD